METARLLDDGVMCLGVNNTGRFGLVPYTSPDAIRFTCDIDACNCRKALIYLGALYIVERTRAAEHTWE